MDRVHGTALGIGERVGNTEMDLLLVNLQLLGMHDHDLTSLPEYCALVAEMCGLEIPPPTRSSGRTPSAPVPASTPRRSSRRWKGDDWLVDRVYSGVPASMVGLRADDRGVARVGA